MKYWFIVVCVVREIVLEIEEVVGDDKEDLCLRFLEYASKTSPSWVTLAGGCVL